MLTPEYTHTLQKKLQASFGSIGDQVAPPAISPHKLRHTSPQLTFRHHAPPPPPTFCPQPPPPSITSQHHPPLSIADQVSDVDDLLQTEQQKRETAAARIVQVMRCE